VRSSALAVLVTLLNLNNGYGSDPYSGFRYNLKFDLHQAKLPWFALHVVFCR
jgi:hypothetical protein